MPKICMTEKDVLIKDLSSLSRSVSVSLSEKVWGQSIPTLTVARPG